ncbi:MAG: hypothetical protein KGZ25_00615, partial [Planctomycetes bacterium]|nr:hypothetical protein [Planctomycetota bacterium]
TLTQGMSRRKVRELLGEPDTTAKAGSREIWKYEEGEAIVFEEGKLKQHERDEVAKKDPLGIDIKGKQGIDRFLGNGNARGPGGNVCACDTVLFSAKTGLAKGMVCVCNTISGYGKRDGVRRANKRLCTCNYICTCNMVCTVNTVGKDCGCVGVCGCESVVCRSVNMR